MMISRIFVCILVIGAILAPSAAFSQSETAANPGDVLIAYGKVINKTANSITVNAYTADREKEEATTFAVGPDVKISNADSYDAIGVGQEVEVGYTVKDKQKEAVYIYLD